MPLQKHTTIPVTTFKSKSITIDTLITSIPAYHTHSIITTHCICSHQTPSLNRLKTLSNPIIDTINIIDQMHITANVKLSNYHHSPMYALNSQCQCTNIHITIKTIMVAVIIVKSNYYNEYVCSYIRVLWHNYQPIHTYIYSPI